VLIDWSREFDQWLSRIEEQGGPALRWTTAMLAELQDLEKKPTGESATFKRVRQARRHELWRVSHPFDGQVAVRIICWFPDEATVVIALVGFDKAKHGDVWYSSAAARGEALVDQWLREHGQEGI
jgi:hypothetical protein